MSEESEKDIGATKVPKKKETSSDAASFEKSDGESNSSDSRF